MNIEGFYGLTTFDLEGIRLKTVADVKKIFTNRNGVSIRFTITGPLIIQEERNRSDNIRPVTFFDSSINDHTWEAISIQRQIIKCPALLKTLIDLVFKPCKIWK